MRLTTPNAMNTPRTLLVVSAVGLALFGGLNLLADDRGTPLPCSDTGSFEQAVATTVVEASAAELEPRIRRQEVAAATDLAAQVCEGSAPPRKTFPLTLELYAPDEWLAGVPVSVVWDVRPDHRGLENVLVTDAAGKARIDIQEFEQQPKWFWADLGFPTLGLAGRPIPPDGGSLVLPMVMPAYVEIVVAEEDGTALQEQFFVEVRAPSARAPSNRWIKVAMTNGKGRTPVEAGIDLEARVTTLSGRETLVALRAPVEPEKSIDCRLTLRSEGRLSIDLHDVDGSVVALKSVRVVDRVSRLDAMLFRPSTDANGRLRFRLPNSYEWRGAADLLLVVNVAGEVRYADLQLDLQQILDGHHAGVRNLKSLPRLVGGLVRNGLGGSGGAVALVLELGLPSGAKSGRGGLVWRPVDRTVSQPDGSFLFRGLPPRDGQLRVRGPASRTRVPLAVNAQTFENRIVVPREATGRQDRLRRMLELMAAADGRD